MWLLKWNVFSKISLLHFPLFIYLSIYEIILQIRRNPTDHFCSSGNREMYYWPKSSVQDTLGPACQACRRQSRNTTHAVYKLILLYLMKGEERKIIQRTSGLPYRWLNMRYFWWMKVDWKNILCPLLMAKRDKTQLAQVPRVPIYFVMVYPCTQKVTASPFLRPLCFPELRWLVVKGHQVTRGVLIRKYPSSPWNPGVGKINLHKMLWVEELQDFFQPRRLPAQLLNHDGIHVYVNSWRWWMAWNHENLRQNILKYGYGRKMLEKWALNRG